MNSAQDGERGEANNEIIQERANAMIAVHYMWKGVFEVG